MPRRKEITNNLSADLISMQIYSQTFDFKEFNINEEFEKWASVEVFDSHNIPERMEPFELSGGLYAVFVHRGSSTDNSTFQYIFNNWLPNSGFEIDFRPHFEIFVEKYKNADPNSEEEILIPIKKCSSTF